MNNTYEKPLFNSFSHMLFIAFVSFNGFFIYLPQFLFSTFRLFFIYYNNLHLEPQWFFYISAFISTFLPYFLLYSAVINAPLPFPAWIMINLSDQLLIRRFHKLPDFYIACFKQQMDMVCHQAIRMQPAAIFTQ